MHTQLMEPFIWHQGQWPCDLDRDLYTKTIQILDFVAAGGNRVSQPNPFLLEQKISSLGELYVHIY